MIKDKHIRFPSIILTIILVLAFSVHAETVAVPNPVGVTPEQLQNTILTENAKTRTDLTNYWDKKVDQLITTFRTEGQKFIDDNFKVLDERMHQLARQFLIQWTVATIGAIIAGNAIWFFIRRTIMKKEEKRPRYLLLDADIARRYGLISPEYAEKLTREDKTVYQAAPHIESKPTPNPPTMDEIEEMLKKQRAERDRTDKDVQAKLKQMEEAKREVRRIEEKLERVKRKEEKKLKTLRPAKEKLEAEKQKLQAKIGETTVIKDVDILPPDEPRRTQ